MNLWKNIQTEKFMVGKVGPGELASDMYRTDNAIVMYCTSGSCLLEIDMVRFLVEEFSQVVILPESTLLMIGASEDFEVSVASFSSKIFWEASTPLNPLFFGRVRATPVAALTNPTDRIYVRNFFEAMMQCRKDDGVWAAAIARNIIQSFLLDISGMYQRTLPMALPECSRPETLFKNFIQLVSKNCACEREVNFYAEKLCITPRYLSTVVKNVTGASAKSMIDKHSVLSIKNALKSTDLSIQEISDRMNFPNQSFFSRYFKRFVGLTPSQYRKESV